MTSKDDIIAERRGRYEALKAAGRATKALPGPSPRPAADRQVLRRETVPGGWYTALTLLAGQTIRLQTGPIPSAVALVAWRRDDTAERINYADTVKVQWTTALSKGRVIFSDMGRVMLSVVEDSGAYHDAIIGGSTAGSNAKHYEGTHRNTRDNFLLAALKLGLQPRDIPPCITFFAPVRVDDEGRLVWHADKVSPGDYVELRAEMDLLIAVSNCPHPLDPSPVYDPAPIELVWIETPPVGDDDLCRNATEEAKRGFDNLALLAV
jgi:urea carboxylase-associated protein 2